MAPLVLLWLLPLSEAYFFQSGFAHHYTYEAENSMFGHANVTTILKVWTRSTSIRCFVSKQLSKSSKFLLRHVMFLFFVVVVVGGVVVVLFCFVFAYAFTQTVKGF